MKTPATAYSDIKTLLKDTASGVHLSSDTMKAAVLAMMTGDFSAHQTASFLTSLKIKGETAEEVQGCVDAMMALCQPLQHDLPCTVDTCGTGGDGLSTFNISTAAAFVAAAAGVPIAKHGNRAASGQTGSADVLEALGLSITLPPSVSKRLLEQHGLCFLFAPRHHPAMAQLAQVRKDLGFKTIFNLAGPLTNPAGATRQLIGTPSYPIARLMADVIVRRPENSALIVAGHSGMDELSTTGPNTVFHVHRGIVETFTLTPEELGLSRSRLSDLAGGSAAENAIIIEQVLCGTKQSKPQQDIVLFNAGAAIFLAGLKTSISEGVCLAKETLISGRAFTLLQTLREEHAHEKNLSR